MKNKTIFLTIVLFLISQQLTFGAFPVKHSAARNLPVLNAPENTNAPATDDGSANASLFLAKADSFAHRYNGNHHHPAHRRSDTNGILSLIFGIAGLVIFPVFSIPAIILGSIGKKHHERCAEAGFILGIIGAILLTLSITVILLLGGI